jgi:hypothetical protein
VKKEIQLQVKRTNKKNIDNNNILRASPVVFVKIVTENVLISTLATHFLKNTPTIFSILLFIFFKD